MIFSAGSALRFVSWHYCDEISLALRSMNFMFYLRSCSLTFATLAPRYQNRIYQILGHSRISYATSVLKALDSPAPYKRAFAPFFCTSRFYFYSLVACLKNRRKTRLNATATVPHGQPYAKIPKNHLTTLEPCFYYRYREAQRTARVRIPQEF